MSLLAQDERLTRRVGGVTLVLAAAAALFVVFLADEVELGSYVRVRVYFHHTGGLREGAPLVVAGEDVGRVETIARAPRGASGPLGGDEGVAATVAIPRAWARRIVRGGDVFVASRGPLGARYLELGPAPAGAVATLADDPSPLLGRDPPSLDRVLARTWSNLTIAREFAEAVQPELEVLRARVAELAATIEGLTPAAAVGALGLGVEARALAAEARRLRDVGLGGPAGLARLDAVLARARDTIAQARATYDLLGARAGTLAASTTALRARVDERGGAALRAAERAIDQLRAAIAKVDPLLAKVDDLRGRIERGEGTIGRLRSDPEFPEDAKELGKILKRKPWRIIVRPKDTP